MRRKLNIRSKRPDTVTLINRNDTARPVVQEAEKILQEVKGRALYMIPFRLMRHLPQHDSLLRPVDPVRVSFLSAGMSSSGFRRHEPVCANDPIPEIQVPMHIIGGNHRHASTRDSGQVLVPTNRVSSEQLRKLMRLLKKEDQLLVDKGLLKAHYSETDEAFRCLQILATTLQSIEPAPKALTCLQQVQLIRTAVRNDPMLNFEHVQAKEYGGAEGLRNRIFPAHAGSDNSGTHFLVNEQMSTRHKNKLLAGTKVLIYKNCPFSIPELGDRNSLLDVLVLWESKGCIPQFLDTHLSYAGPIAKCSPQAIPKIMEDARSQIENGNFKVAPFNTDAFRLYGMGRRAKKGRIVKGSSRSPSTSPRGKRKSTVNSPVTSRKNKRRKIEKVSTASHTRPVRNKSGDRKAVHVVEDAEDTSESAGTANKAVIFKTQPEGRANEQGDSSCPENEPGRDTTSVLKGKKIEQATRWASQKSKLKSSLRSSLHGGHKIRDSGLENANEIDIGTAMKSNPGIRFPSASNDSQDSNDVQALQKRIEELRHEKKKELMEMKKKMEDKFRKQKEQEITAVKARISSELQSQTEQTLRNSMYENQTLRRTLIDLQKQAKNEQQKHEEGLQKLLKAKNDELIRFKNTISSEIRLELKAKSELSKQQSLDENRKLRQKMALLEKEAQERSQKVETRVAELLKENQDMRRKLEAAEVRRTSHPRIPTVALLEGYSKESLRLLKQRILAIEEAS